MSTDSQNKSFGRYLKAVRTDKGIRLQDISARTRIGVDFLTLLEEENHERLPAEVFVKGFIRAYAKVVEADGDLAIERYLESRQTFMAAAQFESDLMRSSDVFWPRLGIGLLALAVIISLSVLLYQWGSHSDEPPAPAPVAKQSPAETKTVDPPADTPEPQAADPTPADAAAPPAVPVKEPAAPAPVAESAVSAPVVESAVPAPAAEDAQNLVIEGVEDTWLKVGIDDNEPTEYYLKPGDRLELRASSQFDLFIGNAGGIRMALNGEPVAVAGRSGQVKTLKLP